jgi:predicted nucleotidyltransferase
MVEPIRTDYPRQTVIKTVKSNQDKILCALIYGSYAKNSDKPLTDQSDIDLILIFKADANPFPVIQEIEDAFEKEHVYYDLGWFTEERFFELLKAKVDLCLWWSLFRHSEIVCSEKGFLESAFAVLHDSSPLATFGPTVSFRNDKTRQLVQSIARNFHRIVIDAIWVLYYKNRNLSSWDELPNYHKLVEKALDEGIISQNIAFLARYLETLRKTMEKQTYNVDFGEIQTAWELTNAFIQGVVENKPINEIALDPPLWLIERAENLRFSKRFSH